MLKTGLLVVRLRNLFPVVAVLVVVVAGCSSGPRLVTVKGQLLYNKKPLPVSEKMGVSVTFIAVDAGENPAMFSADPAAFNHEDSTFVITGREGRGIPVGKYRIAISQKMVDEPPAEVETMNEMFSRRKSAIIREVTSAEPIILELSKPEG
jgi:hypothetical protein